METTNNLVEDYFNLLEKNLQLHQSFSSYSSPDPTFQSSLLEFSTVFSNSIIMMNIVKSNSNAAKEILEKLSLFLKKQRNEQLSFNYWDNTTPEYVKIPYPDDLDDTFCTLSALHQYDDKYLTGKDLRKITDLLVYQEVSAGGPYYTWITEQNDIEWKDVDLAVNSNIAFFLSLLDIHLPGIDYIVEEAIQNNKITSRYYPQSTPVAYFISKWYRGAAETKLISILEKMYEAKASTILDKILVSTALLNLNLPHHPLVQNTFEIVNKYPSKVNAAYPFYRGVNPLPNGKMHYSGSASLSISFAIQFVSTVNEYRTISSKVKPKKRLDYVNSNVFRLVSNQLKTASGPISKHGLKRLSILAKNPDMSMITNVPQFAYASIKNKSRISNSTLEELSIGTLYGWLAYDIYDDFFDNEGIPSQLSVANFSLRHLTSIFTSDYLSKEYHNFFHKIMSIVDNANANEAQRPLVKLVNSKLIIDKDLLKQAKYINKVYEKSIGHILGVIAVYSISGIEPSDIKAKKIIKFFELYLEARQMIDDMHDWEIDLENGKLNSASAQLIIDLQAKKAIKFSIQELRAFFWEDTVINLCKKIKRQIASAEKKNAEFSKILEPLKSTIKQTEDQHRIAFQFLSE